MTLREIIYNGKPIASVDVDNDPAIAYVPSNEHATTYLLGIDADYSAAVAAIKNVTVKTGPATVNGMLSTTVLSRGGNFNVQHTSFSYVVSRAAFYKAADVPGVALAAGTIPIDKWGIYLSSVDSAGVVTSTPGAANFTTGFDTEALAIAALPATPAGDASMGHTTVLTAVGFVFVGGTDALEGGTGGNVSSDTNFVSTTAIVLTTVGAPTRWDFANGPFLRATPAIFQTKLDQALLIELEASGTGAITGRVVAWVAAP